MRDVFVAGVGMTKFGRQPDRSLRDLSEDSVGTAMKDAGVVASDIQTIFFGNAIAGLMTGQEMVRGQSALRGLGVLGVPVINVENACASASTAFNLAYQAVASGAVDVALAVGSEKMSHPDKNHGLVCEHGSKLHEVGWGDRRGFRSRRSKEPLQRVSQSARAVHERGHS